jgi:hypothetical protein
MKKKAGIAVVVIGVLTLGGVAAASPAIQHDLGLGGSHGSVPISITQDANGTGNPAVALLPDGPSQPLSFTLTNPGSGSEYVNTVSIAVATNTSTGDIESVSGDVSTDVSGCLAAWYTVSGSPVTVQKAIPANGSLDVTAQTSGASVRMIDSHTNQDACQTHTVGIAYTSD